MATKRAGPHQMLKKERKKFYKLLAKWADTACEPSGYKYGYPWKMLTTCGWLYIHAHGEYATIFTKFTEPDRAIAKRVNCNPYSGKWNHHWACRMTAQEAFDSFTGQVDALC